MTKYNVTGMSCAACSARVEKAVAAVEGVDGVCVSLLTNSMMVEGAVMADEVIKAVEAAGYEAYQAGAKTGRESEDGASGVEHYSLMSDMEEALSDRETPFLRNRLIWSIMLLLPLMYISMGHVMWDWPLPNVLSGNAMALGLIQLLLSSVIMLINQRFFVNGIKGAIRRAPNMDTLVALGSGASYVYSLYGLFAISYYATNGNHEMAMETLHHLYFESSAMILALITLGKLLEAYSKGKTTDAIKALMKLAPQYATVIRDGVETQVPVEQVKKGDIFVVRPGESIPVDGMVIEGSSAVDEAALTGESIPVDKEKGSLVSAATINQSGFIKCLATRVGQDTALSQIIQMVTDAAATKAPIAKLADKVSGVFVPIVIGIATVTFVIWIMTGAALGFALARGISVLVISCPCALGLATPVAIMVGNGMGAKHGILFKTATVLEETGRVNVVALDKTGTITKGKPQVTNIVTVAGVAREELLKLALSLEVKSEHPLAKAIVEYCMESDESVLDVEDFRAYPGNGITATYENIELAGGNYEFISTKVVVPEDIYNEARALSGEGKTPLYFSCGENLLGVIAVADVVKPDSIEAIRQLQNMGIHVVMLTGDNQVTAQAIGDQVGVDQVIAGVLPDGKEQIIRDLMEGNKVAMVGDGINDAPALTRAHVGIAIGAGTDIAIDAADVVLMKSSLMDVAVAIRLSRQVLKNIKENLFWAFIYNIIGIPVAAGALYYMTGLLLNPMVGAAAMSLSSFCVVSNALRLNLFNVHSTSKDKQLPENKKYVVVEKSNAVEAEADKVDMKESIEAITEDSIEEVMVDAIENATEDYIDDVVKATMEAEDNIYVEENIRDAEKDERNINNEESERGDENMEKLMKIEGMMCGHCEARVKKTLEAFEQVDEAVVSHEKGEALVKLNASLSNEELAKAVEEQDYKVVSIS